jgi:hypothetical protein
VATNKQTGPTKSGKAANKENHGSGTMKNAGSNLNNGPKGSAHPNHGTGIGVASRQTGPKASGRAYNSGQASGIMSGKGKNLNSGPKAAGDRHMYGAGIGVDSRQTGPKGTDKRADYGAGVGMPSGIGMRPRMPQKGNDPLIGDC